MSRVEPEIVEVDPKRLDWGAYDHHAEKETGKGDIRGSYSADTIGLSGKVRRPFKWRGNLMVCVGTSSQYGISTAEAYRLVPFAMFTETPTTYDGKTGTADGAEAARNDPNGFYHGMTVVNGKESYVLVGPPLGFRGAVEPMRPDAMTSPSPEQLSLF